MGREEKWGGQLWVASLGWLQSPFFIGCLNQGHFFLSLFSSISMNFFDFFLQNIMVREVESGGRVYLDMKAQRNI
jgi:hypothetical protein